LSFFSTLASSTPSPPPFILPPPPLFSFKRTVKRSTPRSHYCGRLTWSSQRNVTFFKVIWILITDQFSFANTSKPNTERPTFTFAFVKENEWLIWHSLAATILRF
jgi:hypothetical protein